MSDQRNAGFPMTRTTNQAAEAPHGGNVPVRFVLAVLATPLALLAWRLWGYFAYALSAIANRYGIDFGEGIVWQQMLLIPGPRMYGDIHTYPYVVFHYTPLFHLVVRGIAGLGADVLAGGRALSVASTLVACAAVAAGARQLLADQGHGRVLSWVVAGLAGALLLTFKPIWLWSVLLKSDALALALTSVGFVCMLHAGRRPMLGILAMLLFVMAVYAKQTMIAAPAAALLVWLLRDPGRGVRLGLAGLVFGLVPLAWFTWATQGGFLRHVFLYNVNPYSLAALLSNIWSQHLQSIYALLALLGFAALIGCWRRLVGGTAWRTALRQDERAFRAALLMAFFVLSAAMQVTMGKEGAGFNYLMEWFAAAAMGMAVLFANSIAVLHHAWRTGHLRSWAGLAAGLVPVLLSVQLVVAAAPPAGVAAAWDAQARELDELVEMVRAADKPVLSDDMVVLMRAGKEVPLESAIFHSLSAVGVWDQRPFVAMLAAGAFAFIVTDGDDGSNLYDGRYTREMRDAIRTQYPTKRIIGGHIVHLPRQ